MFAIKKIFLWLLSFLVTIIILDIFISRSWIITLSATDFSKELGRCRRKNMNFVYFNEGFSMGKFNQGRYVGAYYPEEKPSNTLRIGILGDSYVEGLQVFERNHFIRIAEKKLYDKLKQKVQILNFGRSGFDLGDMYVYYQKLVKPYHCDYVMFFVSNEDLHILQTDDLIPKVRINDKDSIYISYDEMPVAYKKAFIKQLPISHLSSVFNLINKDRKIIKAGRWVPILLDKIAKFFVNDVPVEHSHGPTQVSKLSYLILDKLRYEDSKIIIVNRDKMDLNADFVKKIQPPLKYFEILKVANLFNRGFDPYYWKVTNKYGHLNNRGHIYVGEALSNFNFK